MWMNCMRWSLMMAYLLKIETKKLRRIGIDAFDSAIKIVRAYKLLKQIRIVSFRRTQIRFDSIESMPKYKSHTHKQHHSSI